jgi:aminopeptidase N
MIREGAAASPLWLDGLDAVLRDEALDPAFRALCLRLPADDEMAQWLADAGHVPDPDAIRTAAETARRAIAHQLERPLSRTVDSLASQGSYSPDAASAGRRALRLACLALLTRLDGGERAARMFAAADNMTEIAGALACLIESGRGDTELAAFHDRWKGNRLVIDKWFSLQVAAAPPDRAAETAIRLSQHPDFDWKNPNRFRALLGGLAANHAGFHTPSGAAYGFYADWLIRLDAVNPQTTARMSTAFETWRRYGPERQALIRAELSRIAKTGGLSRDTGEMVARMLGSG